MNGPPLDSQLVTLVEAGPMNADFTTTYHEIGAFDCGSMVINWTGANSTTAQLVPQFSNDLVCWCNYTPEASAQRVDAATGCKMYSFETFCFRYVRLRFVRKTNSAGAITVTSFAKRQWRTR